MTAEAIHQNLPVSKQQNMLARWWDTLTRPHPSITDIETKRQSRLLAGIQMSIIISSFVGQLVQFMMGGGIDWFLLTGLSIVFTLYIVNRRGNYQLSAIPTVLNHFLVIHMGLVINDSLTWLLFASTAVILAAIFLSFRLTLLITLASIVFQLALSSLKPIATEITNAAPFIVFFFTTSLVLVFMLHRTRLEQERQQELLDANQRLRESELKLEHRVEQRTEELAAAKQETEAALEKALEADNLKSQFLASMSHELRTPLNSILTFTELLEMETFGEVSGEQKDYLQKIFFSGKHLLSLINDVLDITKIQSGMLSLFIEDDFDAYKELDMIASTARNLLEDKPVTLVSDIDPGIPLLRCDKRRIRQVLLNLTSNAVKFTEKGTITLSAKQREGEILFAVIDSGPGIDAEHQALIFEPFIQTETGIKHAGGTGLGLPISKKLMEAHGGQIWLESTEGEGSAFYVRLPMQLPEFSPTAKHVQAASA